MPRPKAFDPADVLHKAMLLFWEKGYEATGVEDLEERMGINRFSIYSMFHSKQELFLAALDRYEALYGAQMRRQLTAGEAGLSAIKQLFTRMTTAAEQENRLGCFMCNCVIERSLVDPETAARVKAHFAQLEEALYAVLKNARKTGEIEGKRNLRTCARYLIVTLQGMHVSLRMGQDPTSIKNVVALILHEVDSW
ncbi:MAG: TetR/AcrR family transcriptional regulator [Candidatus Binatia bacterium]